VKFIHRSFDMIHYVLGSAVGVFALGRQPHGHCFAWAKDCQGLMRQNPESSDARGAGIGDSGAIGATELQRFVFRGLGSDSGRRHPLIER
jgi:hypothetical protein